ncbi:MAG: indolepyruvate oxidoreductase subunit beta, partial [bacterium]
ILICGVGGQGIVLAGDIIGMAARLSGLEAKASEIHGMSQRGGSVVSEVRYGSQVNSPLIPLPGADFVLAFELLEGLRGIDRLRPGGLAIVNRQIIIPSSVTYGTAQYPENVEADIISSASGAIIIDALDMANKVGNPRAVNSVMMGVLAEKSTLPINCWEEAIKKLVKPKFIDINLAAFNCGREICK